MMKFAFAGLRHGHIKTLFDKVSSRSDCQIVAVCDENVPENFGIQRTCDNYRQMIAETDFDVLAIGDYYGARGGLAIMALEAGKHVISDKPLCTSLAELDRIEALSKAKNLKIGCMLDLRECGNAVAAKAIIDAGRLGEIQSIQFGGQHPLNYGVRPNWYFEPGKHGGTLNDIAIHALDIIEWLTSCSIEKLEFARSWNAFARATPDFRDGAQAAFTLSNRCGVLGDVSYFAPDSCGFKLPYYWRFTIWGSKGVMEFNYNDPGVKLSLQGTLDTELVEPMNPRETDLSSFLADVAGDPKSLNTAHILEVSRKSLLLQKLAK